MEIVVHQLMVSLELTGSRVQDDDAARVEIVALTVIADEVRARVSDGRVKQAGLGVEGIGGVRAPARLDPLRIIRPGLGGVAG